MNDDEERRGQFDEFATATLPSSRAHGEGEKRRAGDGDDTKKNHAFTQPLKTPGMSLLGNSKEGDNNEGFMSGNLMSYMMYQDRVENEQRDCQHRIDIERREHEYELCHEKLAVQPKENCAQRQLMNVMMMTIINKNNNLNNNSAPNHSPMDN